jgi:pimeloyl-ACP methyl ester carboxylesterase
MSCFDSSHGRIAYTDSQEGQETLIFMHGLPTAKELFKPLLPFLKPSYRVVTFDLNDYGQSEKIGRHISHRQRADVLDELRAHLQIEQFHLVAHDLGASVAIDYMGAYAPRVHKLVLKSPPVYPYFREPFIVKLTRTRGLGELLVLLLGRRLFKIGVSQGLVHKERLTPELLRAFSDPFTCRAGRAALLRVLRWGRPHDVFKHYPDIIKSIRVPTLILQGRHDPYIPLSQVARLHEDIPGSKLVIIEDAAHFIPIDTPRRVAQEIYEFI